MRALRTLVSVLALLFVTLSVSQAKINYAYVANYFSNSVSVINTNTNLVVATIAVGTNPQGVAVNQAGSVVYVTNTSSNNVSVISTSTNTVVATIPVQSGPADVAFSPSGKTAYVGNANSNSVSVINTGTRTVVATIAVQNGPFAVSVTPNGAFAYVANSGSGTVSVISTLTNKVVSNILVGSNPKSVAISPDGSTVYVANAGSNTVSVIRTADNTVVKTIGVSNGPYGAAVSPDGHFVYVTNNVSNNLVTVIDTGTQTVLATIVVGSAPLGVAFTQDSAFAYVANQGSNDVSVINTASRTVVQTIVVGSNPFGAGVMGTMKVTTVAGGFVGDKGPATSAALGAPYSSVLDAAGNLYISDFFSNRIRKVDTSGTITTYAGNGICGYNGENVSASKALVCATNGLALDSAGNLIYADSGRIRKIDHSTGKVTTIAGNGVFAYDPSQDGGPALKAAISQVFQIAYDAAGNLFFDEVGVCVIREVDTSGIIHTVAGTGTCGYSGDGGLATAAQLNLPRGVAFDGSGNLYIGDTDNCVVRKVNTSGIISTFAGIAGNCGFSGDGGPAGSAAIGRPTTLTVRSNVLYISNAGRQRVRTVDLSSNIINTYAGSSFGYDGDGHSLTATEFAGIKFSLFDPSANPIFNDGLNGRVRKATGGIVHTIAGGFVGEGVKATLTSFGMMEALAFDKSNNLYIADQTGNRVRKVSGGVITTIAGTGINGYSGDGGLGTNAMLNEPLGVAVDSNGNVFIADNFNGLVRKVDTSDIITTFAADANFCDLLQMATDSSNNIYVADDCASVIFKITPAGVVSVVAGMLFNPGFSGDGGQATAAQLNGPSSVTFDSNGNMYIADFGNSRVREVNTSGIISTIAGNGTCGYTGDGGSATAAELCPNSVAVDKAGAVYVADFNFERIRKIKGGTITTFAGAGFGFNGDKLWPLYTTFDDPVAVAVDSKGAVYELDDWDHRVRKIQ